MSAKKKWYLGSLKNGSGPSSRVYLEDFSWACDWYWSGGSVGNNSFHTHFNGCFLDTVDSRGHSLGTFYAPSTQLPEYLKEEDVRRVSNGCSVWESLDFFLNNAQYDETTWWRIKDLFKQFYALKATAEVFRLGGHCSTGGKRAEGEINKEMEDKLNTQIKDVIIPEIQRVLTEDTITMKKSREKDLTSTCAQ